MSTKSRNPINDRILIVSDSADEINDLQHLLAMDFGSCLHAGSKPEGFRLYIKHHPSVLILAFLEIEISEQFYKTLYQYDKHIHADPHQSLLLCKGNESERAFQLCKNGAVDDYVADRPLYDPFRLRLSVAQAFTRCNQKQHSYLLNHQIEQITEGLQQFDQSVCSKLSSGVGQHQETILSFHHFTENLTADLQQLEENLLGTSTEKTLQPLVKETLSHRFEQFRKESLQGKSHHVLDKLNKTAIWLEGINKGYKQHAKKVHQADQTAKAIQIMVVNNDDIYREILITILQDAGIQVLGISDGRSALDNLQDNKPNLILLDYNLPDIDGITTLKQIKSNPNTSSIPVFMLTEASEREKVDQILHAGATDCIAKPFDRSTLLSKIDAVIKR